MSCLTKCKLCVSSAGNLRVKALLSELQERERITVFALCFVKVQTLKCNYWGNVIKIKTILYGLHTGLSQLYHAHRGKFV